MKPKLLFLCQTLPFPPDSGVNIRSYNILRLLARDFDVVALCFFRSRSRLSDREVDAGVQGLSQFARVEAFPIPQEQSRIRLLADHARSCIARKPYTRFVYESGEFRSRLKHWLANETFSIVHLDSLDLLGYLPEASGLPVVCVHHNVESQLLERRAMRDSNWFRRWYMMAQARLLRRAEQQHCSRVELNTTVSGSDMDLLLEIAPDARTMVVPNGVDTEYFQPESSAGVGLVYAGGINWFPNLDALNYFAETIYPLLARRGFRSSVKWLGRSSDAVEKRFANSPIEIVGRVPDVRPYVRDAACYVVPLRVGGGTRLKILDAWAMGKAVVSTSIGCEGLDAVDGENILIRDDPDEFASAVMRVLSDDGLRTRLQRGGRETAERVYSWEVIGEPMREVYMNLVGSTAAPSDSPVDVNSGRTASVAD
jgi:glycosyltransferase involved in cell wall biosynthesis